MQNSPIGFQAATKVSLWINDDIGSFELLIMDDSRIEIFEDDKGLERKSKEHC